MSFGAINVGLILITVLVSMAAFNDQSVYNKLILWPRRMHQAPRQYYRLVSSGFIHADWMHLFFNMFTLFFFGNIVELSFKAMGMHLLFPLLYLAGIVVASLPSFLKNRNNSYYRSLGASGGVAAVLFSSVYFSPWDSIYIYFIKMPNIVFAALYLGYSVYMSRKGGSTINHDAHFWGAVFGLVFTFIFDPTHGQAFWYYLQHPRF